MAEIGGKVAHQRRSAADCGEYRQAAGAFEQGLDARLPRSQMHMVHLKVSEGCRAFYS
jgi:hypothetical protein